METAAAEWSPSVTVSESGTRYGFGQDVAPDGTGIVVWSAPLAGEEGYSINVREVGVDGQLGTKVALSGAAPGAVYTSAYAPAVRYDAAGTATVVWMESTYSSDSCFAESGEGEEECVVDEYVRARQIDAAGSLSPVREIQHRQTVLPEEGSFGGTSPAYVTYGLPVFAGGPAGTLTVLWPESTFGSGCTAYGYSRSYSDSECEADQTVKWARLSGAGIPQGTAQSVLETHTSGYGSGEPLLRLRAGAAADGTVTVLFGARRSSAVEECWGGESSIGFFRVEADGDSSAPEELDSGCGVASPDLAVDPGGAVVAVWGWAGTYSDSEALYARIDSAGNASAPQTLLGGEEGASVAGLDVARGTAGSARAVWAAEGSIRSRSIPFTGTLGSVDLVAAAPAGRSFSSPRLAAGPDGSAVVVWESAIEGGRFETALQATALDSDGTPHSPRTLLAPNRWDHGARVSAGPSGSFLSSWRVSVPQHNRIQSARFGAEPVENNDAFAGAQALEAELPSFASGSNVGATKEGGEPDHAGDPGGASVWFTWTATSSGPVKLATCASDGLDPVLAVYSGGSLAGATQVAAARGGAPRPCSAGDAGVRFDAVAGTTYRIAVDGEGGSEGTFGLKLTSREGSPANDAFAAAKVVSGGLPRYLSGSNVDAGREPGEPDHAGDPGGASVWYSWTAPSGGKTRISACGSSLPEPVLAVYTGSDLGSLGEVGSDAAGECGSVPFQAVAGTTYRIAVDGKDGREGRFQLRFAQTPGNDDLAKAQPLSGSLPSVNGSNSEATKEPGEPDHAGDPGGASVWYSWTPSSDVTAFVTACLFAGSKESALLAVYTGSGYGDLEQVGADAGSDSTTGCYSGRSEVRVEFAAGTRYLFAVDGEGGAESSFSLVIEPIPANDSRDTPQVIEPYLPNTVFGSNRHATKQPDEPDHAGDPGGASVWYSWTPASSGTAFLSACMSAGKEQSALLAVYSGSDPEHLTEVAADAGGGSTKGCFSRYSEVSFTFQAGTRYLIALDGPGGLESSFSISFEAAPANDDFAAAQPLVGNNPPTVNTSTRRATKQPGEPDHAGDPGGASVWYSWTPSESGIAVLSACGQFGSESLLLAAYSGESLATLSEVAADAGGGEGCFGGSSEVEFDVVAGESYYIALDDSAGAGLWGIKLEVNLELTPANDEFAAAEQISASSWPYRSNRHATKQPGEPDHAGDPGGASVWFKWTPAEDGLYAISTCSFGALDPLLAVYTGSALGGLGSVADNDDGGNCSGDDAEVRFLATAGTTYRIAVDGKSASTGYFELRIATPPENDDLAAATELSDAASQFISDSNWLATKEPGEPDHAGDPGGASVWYSWTPSESTTVQLTVCSYSPLDPLLAVYTGSSPAGVSPVAGEDAGEDPECNGSSTRLKLAAQGGTTYRIAVDGRAGSYGEFSLELREAPANDDFADAEPLGAELPQRASGNNQVATAQPDEPDHAEAAATASVWYSWTPSESTMVQLTVCSYGPLDPLLAVYTGSSLATLEEIAADDDDGSECSDDDARVSFEATAGTTYRIAVDAKGGEGGWFDLRLRAAGPANDDFADAIEIEPAAGVHLGTTVGAGAQTSEPGSAHQSVWYRMQADHDGTLRLHTCSDTGGPMDLDVFTGSSLTALFPVAVKAAATAVACDSVPGSFYADTPSLAFEAVAGTVYWISVDRYQQLSPSFELRPPGPFALVVNAPANDLRAAAERIPYSGAGLSRTNVGATREPGEPEHAGDPGGGSVWFRWFASATGPVQIETCGSEVDTLLAVYGQGEPPDPDDEGSAGEQYGEEPPSLPPPAPGGALASSDDSDLCGEGSTQSSLELEAQEGDEYLIAVDGKAGETGQVQVNLVFETPDTTPPETHTYIPPAVNSPQLTFSLSRDEPESSFECALDGAPFAPCELGGSDLFPYGIVSGLEEGTHTLAVREVDAAGNPDPTPESRELRVDMVPPQTSFSSGPEGLTRVLGSFGIEADEPAPFFECALDDDPLSYCSPPYFPPDSLPDGQHTVRAVAIDEAGNRDPTPATRTFDLDRTLPVASIDEGPEGTVEADQVEFEFSADEEATFVCELDGKAAAACESPRSYPGLADAEHRFEVVSTDLAGNVGEPVERIFRVEARPPETTIKAGPAPRVASSVAGFAFSGDEELSGFDCALDGEAFEECEEELKLSGLAEGPHTLLVRAVDLAGKQDPTPVRRDWVVDTLAPETTIDSGPSGLTRFRGPFDFSADEDVSRFECAVDWSEEFFTCFPGYSIPDLPDGGHTLHVRAIDLAGNVDPTPSEATFDLDTTPPGVEITSAPPPLTQSDVSIEFEVDDPEATTRCRIDDHLGVACISPFEFRGVGDGPHTITITATDLAGNQRTATTEEFTVDEQPPETWVDTDLVYGPGPVSLYFFGSADATEYRCSLDEEPFSECVPPLELEDLPDGEHRLRVYAIDSVGNVDPTPGDGVFVVDTVPPETTIIEGPEGPVHELTPTFSFESSEDLGKFECAMDGSGFRSCDGIEHDRRLGAHLFEVRAFDPAGNVDPTPASFPFTFVNQAPGPSLELDRTAGPGPLQVAATIEATDGDDDPLRYEVQFGDGTSANGFLPHAALSHTYEEPGVYVVRLEVNDGFEKVATTETVTVGPPEPLSARAGDDRTAVAGDPIRLDGSDSRPLRGIHGFAWSFGDGGTGSGETVDHIYEQPGTYEAQLAVTRHGEEATDTATIRVLPPAPGTAKVTVLGDGSPLAGAEVIVRLAGGSKIEALTDGTGVARLHGLADGSYTIAAYKPGYLPEHGELIVADGTGAGQVELRAGELATATVESHPMTLEEIEAAGIDPNDPDNQHVYEFEVHLDIDPPSWTGDPPGSHDIEARVNRRGFSTTPKGCLRITATTCRSSVGGSRVYTHVEWVEGAPLLSSLVIPFRATFLKEFYEVSLIVNNLAPPGFDLRNGSASIEVPNGMSLAPTAKRQSLDVPVADVPGGGSATVDWVLRGDTEGEYHVAAHYGATLEPFGRSVKLDARTAEPIKVWGGSALKLEVDVDDASLDGYPFKVFVKLRNVADVPVYNPAVELLKKGRVGYIEQPRQRREYGIRELIPGGVHTAGPFVLVPEPTGKVDLTQSFIRKTAGDVSLEGTIVTHPRSPKFNETPQVEVRGYGDKLVLDWEPVAGAAGYQVFRTFDREVDFPDDPLADDRLDPTRAVIRGIDPDQHAFYGISSLLNPQEMVHPLTFGTGEMNREWPKLAVDAGDRCDSRDMAVNLRFEALDFELASYEMSLNDLPFGSSQPLDGYSGSTTVHVPFATDDEDADFEVTVRDVEGTERTAHANLACDYVALGDSYASGEGVPEFESGSHKSGNHCHRSNHAYSKLLAADDSLRRHVGDRLSFHACSGAEIEDMFEPNDSDHGNEGPQLNHLDTGTHLVTLSIGGNDMKFGDTVRDCTLGGGIIALDPYCRNNHEAGIQAGRKKVEEKLPQILRTIRSRAPGARILVVDYPEIFPRFPVDPVDGFNAALAGSVPAAALSLVMSCNSMIGDNIFPWDLIWLSHEQREANAMFRRTVEGAGVGAEFVSMDRFVGHDSCQEVGAWMHAGNMGHGAGDFVYSFHPNERGQRAMYEAIKEQLSQERPEDGGFRFTIGAGDVVRKVATIGAQRVAKAVFSHWWPGSDVELQLRSPAGRVIGRDTVADDVQHSLTGTFESYTVEDPEPGEWELTFRGVDVDLGGEPVGFQVAEIPEANTPPTPLFRQSTNGGPTGATVSFDASESSDRDGTIEDYEWNFGDGSFGSGIEVDHAFEQPGRYTVRLLVRDDEGQPALHAQEEIWIRDEPRAVADGYGVDAGGELSISAAAGLLANDSVDRSGGEPRIELVSGATHGTLELASDGGFLYRPAAGFVGAETMVYKLSDAGGLVSAPASVRIDVRGAPVDPKTPGPGSGMSPPGGGAPSASGPSTFAPVPKPKALKCKKGFKKKKVRGKFKCVKAKKKRGKKKR